MHSSRLFREGPTSPTLVRRQDADEGPSGRVDDDRGVCGAGRYGAPAMNWLSLAPYVALGAVILGLGIDDGVQRIKVANRDTMIANAAKQEAENVAAARQAVLAAAAKDALATNAILTKLQADLADQQKASAGARVALAAIPVAVLVPGCPDIMASPLITTFIRGLP